MEESRKKRIQDNVGGRDRDKIYATAMEVSSNLKRGIEVEQVPQKATSSKSPTSPKK